MKQYYRNYYRNLKRVLNEANRIREAKRTGVFKMQSKSKGRRRSSRW